MGTTWCHGVIVHHMGTTWCIGVIVCAFYEHILVQWCHSIPTRCMDMYRYVVWYSFRLCASIIAGDTLVCQTVKVTYMHPVSVSTAAFVSHVRYWIWLSDSQKRRDALTTQSHIQQKLTSILKSNLTDIYKHGSIDNTRIQCDDFKKKIRKKSIPIHSVHPDNGVINEKFTGHIVQYWV